MFVHRALEQEAIPVPIWIKGHMHWRKFSVLLSIQ